MGSLAVESTRASCCVSPLRADSSEHRGATSVVEPDALSSRARYELLTSLVVPRPIGWISTTSSARIPNLAPFSFYAALSATPMLVGVSIAPRRTGVEKDSLTNMRAHPWFCVNLVTVPQLESMNLTSAELPPETSEFAFGDVRLEWNDDPEIPFVSESPAVLLCSVEREVDLAPSTTRLVLGRVRQIRLAPELDFEPGSHRVRPESLPAVGRLGGNAYVLPGEIRTLARPSLPDPAR